MNNIYYRPPCIYIGKAGRKERTFIYNDIAFVFFYIKRNKDGKTDSAKQIWCFYSNSYILYIIYLFIFSSRIIPGQNNNMIFFGQVSIHFKNPQGASASTPGVFYVIINDMQNFHYAIYGVGWFSPGF